MVIQKISRTHIRLAFCLALCLTTLLGCAGFSKRTDEASEKDELKQMISQLNQKIDALSAKQGQNDEKIKETLASIENIPGYKKATIPVKVEGVSSHPADAAGSSLNTPVATRDPEAGFANDPAIQEFRKAQLLFQSNRFADAMISFNSFLERFADHPLAGNAQFAIAESYYQQKEMRPALQEFQRVLTSYDRSPRVPDALKRMVDIEESLQMKAEASRHRQTLQALFPQSQSLSPASGKPAPELDAPPAQTQPAEKAPADGSHAT